jgi:hypothetical protein
LTENPIVIEDDDDNDDLMDRSDHNSHQMIVNDLGVEGENTDEHTGGAAHTGEGVANSDRNDAAMSQADDRLAMTTPISFCPEIPESDSAATLDEERQPNPSVQGDSIPSPSGRRSRSLSVSVQADGCSSEWVFDVFAEDDSGAEGDGLPPSKRVRFSLPLLKAADNKSWPAAAVAVEGVPVPDSAHDDQPPQDDQEYKVQQIIGESGLEYEVTAVTKIWLPKASVGPKLVRKYRAEQRTATRVQTRRSSRLQSKN